MRLLSARTNTPEALLKLVGKDLQMILLDEGRAAVREVVMAANKRGVGADNLPYVFWSLATQQELPDLGPRQRGFNLMIDIMARTGAMPNYQRSFQAVDDAALDDAVDAVALHMSMWAARTLTPALIVRYYRLLAKHQDKVPDVTGGKVPAVAGMSYLDSLFREILTLRSAMFDDGELLRRVVRFIPE